MKKQIASFLLNLFGLYLIIFVHPGTALWIGIIYLAQFFWKHLKDKPIITITIKKK